MDVIYSRQESLKLNIPHTATIVGCGGTGFWTALLLAMQGTDNLILVDEDIIELHNLNRLPISTITLRERKTDAVGDFIRRIRPDARVERQFLTIKTEQDCANIIRGSVFCCTDSLKSQQLIQAYCKKNNMDYQRIGYDGTILNVSRAFPLSFNNPEDVSGYTVTPSWVIPAVVAAALGVASQTYKEITLMDDIGTLHCAAMKNFPRKLLDRLKDDARDDLKDDGYACCDDCDRISLDDGEYGYCGDCERPHQDDYNDLEKERDDLGSENSDLQEEMESLQTKIEELEDDLLDRDKTIEELEKQIENQQIKIEPEGEQNEQK